MQGFEPHRLTPQERRIVLAVLALALIALACWITVVVLMLPDPSHGTFIAP
ncbi:MAG: hypothetical protein QJR03_09970 [Sphaerobacter sp.]|nr:hypothetical protein [Sphaerobacter sp.]